MTIEEKAKAYDEALNKARKHHDSKYHPDMGPRGVYLNNADLEEMFPQLKESEDEGIRKELIDILKKSYEFGGFTLNSKKDLDRYITYLEKQKEQKPTEIDEYEIIKKHITEGCISSEVNKRLTECGWYVAERNLAQQSIKDYRLRDTWEYIDDFIKEFGRVPKDIDELSACVDYVIEHKSTNKEKQKHVECIKFNNEFENQVSHLLASVLNGEHEYSNGFIKYVAQSLLGYAKNELNPTAWNNVTINGKPIPTKTQSVDISLPKWSEEDEEALNMCYDLLLKSEYTLIDKGYIGAIQFVKDWLKSLPKRTILQPKQEWNEEDSIKIGTLSSIIFDYAFYKDALDENNDLTGEYAELDNWLESLPDRFNLDPKKTIKFIEKQDYSDLNDLERAIHRGFLVVGIENVPVTIIKETAQDCLAQVKPLEWIEEDMWIMKAIENAIKVYGKTQGRYLAGYDMDTLIAHLKNAFTCLEYNKTLFNSGNGLYYYIDGKAIYMGDPSTVNNPYDFAMSQQENTDCIVNEK